MTVLAIVIANKTTEPLVSTPGRDGYTGGGGGGSATCDTPSEQCLSSAECQGWISSEIDYTLVC